MPHQKKKWVIVFLIYADFRTNGTFLMDKNTKVELNSLLGDVLKTPIDEVKSKIYVILNSINYQFRTENSHYEIEDKTILYEVTNPQRGARNEIGRCDIIDNKFYKLDR